ncbi:hypothetical protein BAUCODRAFT_129765 [Baudoinia panamericana UAMH 10762]|uniref:Ryanodine receptor Ryr domain-containing protein n=1 Tax=Baudoinia panamericana (strain UAMH 10762) TaxID=717646 RepID=M2MMR1_BAUPA|nr:uncharacterized protein BAUCODRAFT_129765 [Baudoinia panamericana UAMH 10762]EMC97976.1 hypothetical protein BAUCODRAFT_129765 [Baudoinia panamericana UAMH 10762]
MSSSAILVAGAVSYNHLVYRSTLPLCEPSLEYHIAGGEEDDIAQLVIRPGGAELVAALLTAAAPRQGIHVSGPQSQGVITSCLKHTASCVCDLAVDDPISPARLRYTIERQRRIGQAPIWRSPSLGTSSPQPGSTVVILGSGEAFKDVEPALDFLQRVRPRYIIHQHTKPLASGRLWDLLRHGPLTRESVPEPDYLAIVVDADDLRANNIAISRALSWEATAEDFVRNLGSNGRLDTLVTCPNLIVRFGEEGVIHHRGRDAGDPKLYYHPRKTEGEGQPGCGVSMIETSSAFIAGLALGFANNYPPDIGKGIRYGMAAADRLSSLGFVHDTIDDGPGFPTDDIMQDLVPTRQHAAVTIPSARISSGEKWSIFNATTGDPAELARQIVTVGPAKALSFCPTQRFGDILAIDRAEQEGMRAVVEAVEERLRTQTSSPTSVGVIGPPGSGKHFTAKNVAKHVSAGRAVQTLVYNARLLRSNDLIAACHEIRDYIASGDLTIVTFENFESMLEPGSELLRDFLALMQDGIFTDNGHVRRVGSPLFFFLVNHEGGVEGGTFDVPPTPVTPTSSELRERVGTQPSVLLDHLHGILQVTGPNQGGLQDKAYPVRRAIMLRQILKERYPHLEVDGKMRVEEGVLHALLLVPSYKLGLRSLEKIISTSRLSGRSRFDVAALPPEEQIQLHVDGRIFMSYLRSPRLQPALRERLAQGLFETYKKRRKEMCKTDEDRKALESDRSYRDWDDLSGELKESTRSQADDIPRKLRAVGCFMLNEERSEPLVRVAAFSEEELLMLSEMEHERFNAERLQRQWRMGPRNSKQRLTPFLVPWRDLTQEWKDVDSVMVECVPRILEKQGWYIYRMKDEVDV